MFEARSPVLTAGPKVHARIAAHALNDLRKFIETAKHGGDRGIPEYIFGEHGGMDTWAVTADRYRCHQEGPPRDL